LTRECGHDAFVSDRNHGRDRLEPDRKSCSHGKCLVVVAQSFTE